MTVLLDTCAVIWTAEGTLPDAARRSLEDATGPEDPVLVSLITAWEIGMLVSRGRLALSMDPPAWFEAVLATERVEPVELSASILIESSRLPSGAPNDPADRIVLATARLNDWTVMTRDRTMLAYAEAGHVRAIPC